ncbi:NUDIX hydrolase domain-like protein, partial [Blyttiomyces helicus]
KSPEDFLDVDWVKNGEAELLFARRAIQPGDRWSGHMAFPGGKVERGESDREGAEREMREEVGIDLRSDEFMHLGALDEREILPPAGGHRIMTLAPFVYLQTTPISPPMTLSADEIAS